MIFASTFFNSPSTGGDIRIRGHRGSEGVAGEGGVQGEGVARGDARGVRGGQGRGAGGAGGDQTVRPTLPVWIVGDCVGADSDGRKSIYTIK